jgi:phosphoribosylanthranilate isomerase
MTWVKICGITNLDDAKLAVEAGADALGFVFCHQSARNVAPETVREITRHLPTEVEKLGVLVGAFPENLLAWMERSGLTGLQFHPRAAGVDWTSERVSRIPPGVPIYLSVPAGWVVEHPESTHSMLEGLGPTGGNLAAVPQAAPRSNPCRAIFFDSGTWQQPGGSGKVFDWRKAVPVVEQMKRTVNVVVAGGLTPSNVAEALSILKPWGVDVSSGVEAEPGKKDSAKVRRFISAVRQADKSA